jgi:hypothetical protein
VNLPRPVSFRAHTCDAEYYRYLSVGYIGISFVRAVCCAPVVGIEDVGNSRIRGKAVRRLTVALGTTTAASLVRFTQLQKLAVYFVLVEARVENAVTGVSRLAGNADFRVRGAFEALE